MEGDAEDEELEVVVANLREQRDKVLALHMCKDFSLAADVLMARRILSCHTTCNCTGVPDGYPARVRELACMIGL